MINNKLLFISLILLTINFNAIADTVIINRDTYEQAKANNYWIVSGSASSFPGETSHWVWCTDISEAVGTGGDENGYQVVVVNTGPGLWVWAPLGSTNPCDGAPRTIIPNPLASVVGDFNSPIGTASNSLTLSIPNNTTNNPPGSSQNTNSNTNTNSNSNTNSSTNVDNGPNSEDINRTGH